MGKRRNSAEILGLCAFMLVIGSAGSAQPAASAGTGTTQAAAPDNIAQRIHRQNVRINHGVKTGTIKPDQATKLRASLSGLEQQVAGKRQADGTLKKEDLTQFENVLNQNNNMIRSLTGAGESVADGGNVLGPKWTPGKDGAQDAAALEKEMKIENRREVRQERQAIEQKIEQQQLDYEHQMLPELATQKKTILKGKQQTKDIRQEQDSN